MTYEAAKKGIHMIPSFIVYNIIFDVISAIGGDFNPIVPLVRAAVSYLFIVFYFIKRNPTSSLATIYPVLFVIYATFLLLFSNEFGAALRVHMRVSIYFIFMIMYYDYYRYVSSDINTLLKTIPKVLIIYILFTIASNIFDFGTLYTRVDEEMLRTGDVPGDFLLQISLCIMLVPLYLHYNKRFFTKINIYILSSLSFLFLLASLRRTSVLVILIGFSILALYYQYKTKVLIYGFIGLIILIFGLIQYGSIIEERLASRNREISFEQIESELRSQEYPIVTEIIFSFDDIFHTFFGKEMYVDRGVIKSGSINRPLHTDYGRILYGMGLIGATIYFGMLISLLGKSFKIRRFSIKNDPYKLHASTAIMLILCKIILTYTGGLHVISYNALLFGVLMAIIGYSRQSIHLNITKNESINNDQRS